jgi:hypothetical protein
MVNTYLFVSGIPQNPQNRLRIEVLQVSGQVQ